MTGLRIDT